MDQLIMCTIYGVCRVHPGCTTKGADVKFNEIIEAYKEVVKSKVSQVGPKLPGLVHQSNVSWIYIEVLVDARSG